MTDQLTTDGEDGVAVVGAAPPRPATRAERRRAQVRAGSTVAGLDRGAVGTRPTDDRGTDDTADAPAADAEDRGEWRPPRRGGGARRPGTVPTRWAMALAVVALAASAAAATFAVKWSGLSDQAAQGATVKRVASTFLSDLTNFKPNTVDADFGALLTFATGAFARQANQFFGTNIRQQLEQAQAQSEGQVRSLYVQSLGSGKAEVYGVVDQTYLNSTISKAGSQPNTDTLRVVLDLADVSGTWKISDVSVLQAPGSSSAATVPAPTP
jgi:hypothetical protein